MKPLKIVLPAFLMAAILQSITAGQVSNAAAQGEDCSQADRCDTRLLDSILTSGNDVVTTVEAVGPTVPFDSEDDGSLEMACVTLNPQVSYGVGGVRIEDGECVLVVAYSIIWAEMTDIIQAGGRVAVGLQQADLEAPADVVPFSLNFAMHLEQGALLGDLTGYDAELNAFMAYENNPVSYGDECTPPGSPDCMIKGLESLIGAWNLEVNGTSSLLEANYHGPIQVSYEQFRRDSAGRMEWAETSPEYRSLNDAPFALRETLAYTEFWVQIPESWAGLGDGAVCLTTSLGSNGCFHTGFVGDGLLLVTGWAVPHESVTVEVRPVENLYYGDAIASWDGGERIGEIRFSDVVQSGMVLVELDSEFFPISYAQTATAAQTADLLTSSALTELSLRQRLALEPVNPPSNAE